MAKQKENSRKLNRDIEFLYELGTLRNMPRAWEQMVGMKCANDLEHTMRVIWLSLIIGRREGVTDEGRLIKMAMVHDIAETRTGDFNYIGKVYVKADEDKAAQETFAGTILEDMYADVLKEYEERKTLISKIVKDADNLDVDVELRELEERGSQIPKKMRFNRVLVRKKKLYTKAGKQLWDALEKADPSAWHLAANKWLKIPTAGT